MADISDARLKDVLLSRHEAKDSDSASELHERQLDLEAMRETLSSTLGGKQDRPFKLDPLCFPFIIPPRSPGTVGNVVAQLKLDTGAVDNWIRPEILERAGIEFEQVEGAKSFVGAGGRLIVPFGQVKITWFSENQAITKESVFFVYSPLPFDVVLGSTYILGSLVEFSEPVLPLRHILTEGSTSPIQLLKLDGNKQQKTTESSKESRKRRGRQTKR